MALEPTSITADWSLEIRIAPSADRIRLLANGDLLLGRVEPGQAALPGLDLTPYQASNLGVSRRHAAIRQLGNQLVLVDLHSDNGTMLNGLRLQPAIPYPLSDGDSLCLGDLELSIHLNGAYGS